MKNKALDEQKKLALSTAGFFPSNVYTWLRKHNVSYMTGQIGYVVFEGQEIAKVNLDMECDDKTFEDFQKYLNRYNYTGNYRRILSGTIEQRKATLGR